MSQTRTLYRLLKAAGPRGVHSLDLRREHQMGDPSRRIADLEEKGYRIRHIPQKRGKTNGTRYILLGPAEVARSQSAGDPGGQSEWNPPDASPLLPTRRPGLPGSAPAGKGFDGRPRRYPAQSMKAWSTRPDDREGWRRVRELDGSWWWELREEPEPQMELVA